MNRLFLESGTVAFDRTKCPLKNCLQLFLLIITSAVGKFAVFSTCVSRNVWIIHRCTRIFRIIHIIIPGFAVQAVKFHSAVQMHVILDLIPWYDKTCAMCTENGTCRIFQIAFRIVGNILYDLFLVFARCIALECAEKFSCSVCVCNDLFLVIAHLGNGCCSF